MTNADRIRNGTDDEIVDYIVGNIMAIFIGFEIELPTKLETMKQIYKEHVLLRLKEEA